MSSERAVVIEDETETTAVDETDEAAERRAKSKDRRKREVPVAVERRSGKDRRAMLGERRRQVDPTTCEKDYTDDEVSFMKAMEQYKRSNRRPFPTWSEVLEVIHALGYRKTEAPTALPGLPVTPANRIE